MLLGMFFLTIFLLLFKNKHKIVNPGKFSIQNFSYTDLNRHETKTTEVEYPEICVTAHS